MEDIRNNLSFKMGELYSQACNEINELRKAKDQAYSERNKLVASLANLFLKANFKVYLARHEEEDKKWEDDWRNIIVIELLDKQLSWHFHDSEMSLFEGFKYNPDYKYDGHTTDQKYENLLIFSRNFTII